MEFGMEMSKMYRWIVVSVLVFSTYAVSEEKQQLLAAQDVSKVMEQILSQHVSQKAVTADIIRKSFLIYIDQFDPNRIYLLESEVSPYTNMSNAEANAILEKYKRNDFSEYEKLNGVIQNAIQRAETTRKDFEQSEFQIAEGVKNPAELEAAEVYPSFAATLSDLQTRQKQHFKNYIASERRHYGDSIVKKREDRLLKLYDQHQTEHENQYLFVKADGIHLTVEEQENIITLHILKALTKSLDAHTSFFNADEAYDMRVRLEKGFDGVGIVLRQSGDIYMVSKLIPNSTAEKSGLVRVGDVIEKVDGASVSSESLHEVMQKLRGKNGTKVQLELKRNMIIAGVPTDKTFNVSLKRESIVINEGRVETSYEKFGNGIIGTIKLHSFYQGT
jgi:carboxyl-terminal processing protease